MICFHHSLEALGLLQMIVEMNLFKYRKQLPTHVLLKSKMIKPLYQITTLKSHRIHINRKRHHHTGVGYEVWPLNLLHHATKCKNCIYPRQHTSMHMLGGEHMSQPKYIKASLLLSSLEHKRNRKDPFPGFQLLCSLIIQVLHPINLTPYNRPHKVAWSLEVSFPE